MHSKILRSALAALCCAVGAVAAQGAPVTFVDTGQSWQYSQMTVDLNVNWATRSLADFASNSGVWSTGASAFGNNGGLPQSTAWAANTDLALKTTFNFSGTVNGKLNLHVASDNGFMVYLNGQLLAKEMAEGYTSYWEYAYQLAPASLVQGSNLLQVMAEDHGGATFFDMKLDADVSSQSVPEPGALALVALALAGTAAVRRQR